MALPEVPLKVGLVDGHLAAEGALDPPARAVHELVVLVGVAVRGGDLATPQALPSPAGETNHTVESPGELGGLVTHVNK